MLTNEKQPLTGGIMFLSITLRMFDMFKVIYDTLKEVGKYVEEMAWEPMTKLKIKVTLCR